MKKSLKTAKKLKTTRKKRPGTAEHLRQVIETQIPLSKFMGLKLRTDESQETLESFQLVEREPRSPHKLDQHFKQFENLAVRISVPIQKARNHHGDGFGGAIVAAQAICGWAMTTFLTETILGTQTRHTHRIVIRKCEAKFQKPIKQKFEVIAKCPDQQSLRNYLSGIVNRGYGKLAFDVNAVDPKNGASCATLQCEFVCLLK